MNIDNVTDNVTDDPLALLNALVLEERSVNNNNNDPDEDPNSSADDLYDAQADSDDERWVQTNLATRARTGENNSDDRCQLACPSCFVLLCVQSQPHQRFAGQFRALFVRNCVTKAGETMRVRVTNTGGIDAQQNQDAGELLRPVACAQCGTEVAVQDADDVYHFCNVAY